MRKELFLKTLAIGFILLFISTSCFPAVSEYIDKSRNEEIANAYENSLFWVNYTGPENGIYFYNHKILPFCVPLILCGPITVQITVYCDYGVDRIEIYLNDVLQEIIKGPGPTYVWGSSFTWASLSKISLKLNVCFFNETISDEYPILRIFC